MYEFRIQNLWKHLLTWLIGARELSNTSTPFPGQNMLCFSSTDALVNPVFCH